jgi:curli biogenesis system outer membrane secretion channel CsgG
MNIKEITVLLTLVVALLLSADVDARRSKKQEDYVADALGSVTCDGPKLRVAVYSFSATGKLAAVQGYNVGEGLAAQLATELSRTDCFIVLDRTAISHVLREQEMVLAGVSRRETGPGVGQITPPQYIIRGSVTELEANRKSRGFSVGLGLSDLPLGVKLGRKGSKAHVAMDLAIINATTGDTRSSHRVVADSKSGGWTLGLDFEKGSVGTDGFGREPLGIATRNALGQAVVKIIEDLDVEDWRSQVIEADRDVIYVNVGTGSGVSVGDTFRVSTVVRTLTDPSTGRVIDRIEREIGSLRITSLANRYAVAEPLDTLDIKRGDFVHL